MGVISPNIRITTVSAPPAMPGPILPNARVARTVANAEALMFTRLFPIRIATSMRDGFSLSCCKDWAPGRPASASASARARDSAIKAVSDPEKNAERHSRTNNEIPSIIEVRCIPRKESISY